MTPLSRWERTIVFDDALWHSAPPPLDFCGYFLPPVRAHNLCWCTGGHIPRVPAILKS